MERQSKAAANRESLFSTGGGDGGNRLSSTAPRKLVPPSSTIARNHAPSPSRTPAALTQISAAERKRRDDRLADAEKFRAAGKAAMESGFFSRADPHLGGNNYRKAADAFGRAGDRRKEAEMRRTAASCFIKAGIDTSAALEYVAAAKAADAAADAGGRDIADVRTVAELYGLAADTYAAAGEAGRGCDARMKGAMALAAASGGAGSDVAREAALVVENAVEAYVPDGANRHRAFRSDPGVPSEGPREIVGGAFAHETVGKGMTYFIATRNYRSALYVAGAVSCLLEADAESTISLARSYASETVLLLALGDVVAASRTFADTHLQRSSYLRSRECKLAEDLIAAVRDFDEEALDAARSDRTVANLDPEVRALLFDLRVSGKAKGGGAGSGRGDGAGAAPGAGGGDAEALVDELDALGFDDGSFGADDEDDDDFDLT